MYTLHYKKVVRVDKDLVIVFGVAVDATYLAPKIRLGKFGDLVGNLGIVGLLDYDFGNFRRFYLGAKHDRGANLAFMGTSLAPAGVRLFKGFAVERPSRIVSPAFCLIKIVVRVLTRYLMDSIVSVYTGVGNR